MFPNEILLNRENFWFQPDWLIFQFYNQGLKNRRDRHHYAEEPMARLMALYLNAHLSEKAKPSTPADHYVYAVREQGIPAIAQDTFIVLLEDNLIPQWCLAMLGEYRYIIRHKYKFKPSYPRAFIGGGKTEGIIVLNPVITDGWLKGSLLISCEPKAIETLRNPHDPSFSLLIEVSPSLANRVIFDPSFGLKIQS